MKNKPISIIFSLACILGCNPDKNPVEVGIGEIAYARNSIIFSRNFESCSAVILDYKDESLMAHALSDNDKTPYFPEDYLTTRTVISKLKQEAIRRRFNLEECQLIIHALDKPSYEILVKDSKEYNLKIKTAEYDPLEYETRDYSVTISYTPSKDEKLVEKVKFNK